MKTLSALVSEQPFFKGLQPQYFLSFNECAELLHFRAHEKIFEKGHEAEKFYLITSGEVAVETAFVPGEGVVTIQTLGQGDPLGWSWLYPPYEWHFSARAVSQVEAIAFDAKRLRQAAAENKAFGYEVAMRVGYVLSRRLQQTRAELLSLCEVS